jgi:16S rRNA (cytidine1402-2'-O)-methyltransferase
MLAIAAKEYMGQQTSGTLFVVGTPIGNLADLSPRARDTLSEVDLIAAEDTRRTGALLASIGVNNTLISYHEHNERARVEELLIKLAAGQSIALVSDAGMPLMSDPGWRLVRAALDRGVAVKSVPGPSAITAALAVCGVPSERFVFEGFLPRRPGERTRRLDRLKAESRTMVFFESGQRLDVTLSALASAFGSLRPAALARELTKVYEQVCLGTLAELTERLGADIPLRGEFVIVVGGAEESVDTQEALRVYGLLARELPPAVAAALTTEITGIARNALYKLTRVR